MRRSGRRRGEEQRGESRQEGINICVCRGGGMKLAPSGPPIVLLWRDLPLGELLTASELFKVSLSMVTFKITHPAPSLLSKS